MLYCSIAVSALSVVTIPAWQLGEIFGKGLTCGYQQENGK
jgi:hypothetical protein